MSEPNYAGNIIVVLANLPDFLRTPILKKRMVEFFAMSDPEKKQLINNALEAGPAIPFPNFSKLFKKACFRREKEDFFYFSDRNSSPILYIKPLDF